MISEFQKFSIQMWLQFFFTYHISTHSFSVVLSKFVHSLLHLLGDVKLSLGFILIETVFILCVLASVHLTKNATQQFLKYYRKSTTPMLVSFAFKFLDTIGWELKLCE